MKESKMASYFGNALDCYGASFHFLRGDFSDQNAYQSQEIG